MERVTKASLVLVLVVTALIAGAEGGRDVPKTKGEVYNPQTFLGLGWPLLGHWPFGWGGPWGGLWPFLGHPRAVGPGDRDGYRNPDHGGDDKGYGGHDGGYGGPGDDKGYGGHAGGYGDHGDDKGYGGYGGPGDDKGNGGHPGGYGGHGDDKGYGGHAGGYGGPGVGAAIP